MSDTALQRPLRAPDALTAGVRRSAPTAAASRRHSRFVGAMKLVLPALAVALIAAVLAWPGTFDRIAPLDLPVNESMSGPSDTMTMVKPRYHGTDGEGRPFMITADAAVQDPDDRKTVTLSALQADMTMTDGSWFTLMADAGRYHQKAKTLELGGEVSVFSDQGYEFHATDVAVDLEAGRAVTEKPVAGHGPFGELTAKRMEITRRGDRLLFGDGVRVKLYAQRSE